MTRRRFLSLLGALPVVGPVALALIPKRKLSGWEVAGMPAEDLILDTLKYLEEDIGLECQWKVVSNTIEVMENCHEENGMLVKTDPSKPIVSYEIYNEFNNEIHADE